MFKGNLNIAVLYYSSWSVQVISSSRLTGMLVEQPMHENELAYVTLDEQAQEFLFG